MRFGVFNDLHLGYHGVGHWHNRLLFDRAVEIVRAAVAEFNTRPLDAVFVLGDITQSGEAAQLGVAHEVLSGLQPQWYVLPGNHDRAAVRTGDFDQLYSGHVIPPYMRLGDAGIVSIRESDRGDAGYVIDRAWTEQALAGLSAQPCKQLLVVSHFPLVDESLWAAHNGGKDAGGLEGGESLLAQLASRQAASRRLVVLCGHEHWHHIITSPGWVHCTTAAMIEYPMEARIVAIEGDVLRLSILGIGIDTITAESIETANWVRGRTQDRDVILHLEKDRNDHEQS